MATAALWILGVSAVVCAVFAAWAQDAMACELQDTGDAEFHNPWKPELVPQPSRWRALPNINGKYKRRFPAKKRLPRVQRIAGMGLAVFGIMFLLLLSQVSRVDGRADFHEASEPQGR
jgi:hypothetical protein